MNRDAAVEPNFQALVYFLATQAMIDLGEIANPLSGVPRIDLRKARWHIALLRMLREKTDGNLDDSEDAALESILVDIDEILRRKEAQGG